MNRPHSTAVEWQQKLDSKVLDTDYRLLIADTIEELRELKTTIENLEKKLDRAYRNIQQVKELSDSYEAINAKLYEKLDKLT